MIVCYAYGEGLGHLTRLRGYLHTIGHHEPVTILTASEHATDPRVIGPHIVRQIPPALTAAATPGAGLREWVAGELAELGARGFVVDAFPAGLRGELDASVVPAGTTVTHLGRLLRWAEYEGCLPERPLRFDRTWLVEPVGHLPYLEAVSGSVAPIELVEPPAPVCDGPPGWLVVHSGPDEEIRELVAYARDMAELEGARPDITLVAPRRPSGVDVQHIDVYPAWPLFEGAERIVTAAGCNVVRQLGPWRAKHRMLPFPRRFDDQYLRASRIRCGR